MISVSSSMMTAVAYDARTRTLTIRFVEGGRYRYRAVPRAVFDALLAAPSKGRFFHEEIDGRYRYAREE